MSAGAMQAPRKWKPSSDPRAGFPNMRTALSGAGMGREDCSEDAGAVELPPPNTVVLDWHNRRLRELPNDFGQLTALETVHLARASACAEWRCCCCGPWGVELGER